MDRIESYLSSLAKVISEMPVEDIRNAVEVLMAAWKRQSTIYTMGNGGSASTASHMANDLNKLTVVEGQPRFRTICVTDNIPLITAWANDDSYERSLAEPLKNLIRADDVLIVISGSGNSPNVIAATKVAKDVSATTLGYIGRDGGKLKSLVDYAVCVPTDWIVQQEDAHLILNHCVATTLRAQIEEFSEINNGSTDAK